MILQQAANALALAGVYVLFALGLSLALGMLRILNLAHGAVYMVGAFIALVIAESTNLSFVWVLLVATAAAGMLGIAIDGFLLQPVRKKSKSAGEQELAIILITIGLAAVLTAIAERWTQGDVRVFPDDVVSSATWLLPGGVRVTSFQVLAFVVAVVATAALSILLSRSQVGRAFRGLAENPRTVSILGINARLMSAYGMFAVSAFAGLAGVMLAVLYGNVHFAMGEGLLLKALAIVILGGAGNLWGTVAGAVTLAILETAVVAYLSTSLRDVIVFALVALALILRPRGLLANSSANVRF